MVGGWDGLHGITKNGSAGHFVVVKRFPKQEKPYLLEPYMIGGKAF